MRPALLRLCLLVALLPLAGCATFYHPIAFAPPSAPAAPGEVKPVAAAQPWGNNPRYQAHARKSSLRMVALTVANGTDQEVRVALDPKTPFLTPAEAGTQVGQAVGPYLLYPIGAAVAFPGGHSGEMFAKLADSIQVGAIAIGVSIAVGNMAVAHHANTMMERFFSDHLWTDGPIAPGGTRQGLVLIHAWPAPVAGVGLQVTDAAGSRTLDVALPPED